MDFGGSFVVLQNYLRSEVQNAPVFEPTSAPKMMWRNKDNEDENWVGTEREEGNTQKIVFFKAKHWVQALKTKQVFS